MAVHAGQGFCWFAHSTMPLLEAQGLMVTLTEGKPVVVDRLTSKRSVFIGERLRIRGDPLFSRDRPAWGSSSTEKSGGPPTERFGRYIRRSRGSSLWCLLFFKLAAADLHLDLNLQEPTKNSSHRRPSGFTTTAITMRFNVLSLLPIVGLSLAQLQPNWTSPAGVSIYNPDDFFDTTGPWSLMSSAGDNLYVAGS